MRSVALDLGVKEIGSATFSAALLLCGGPASWEISKTCSVPAASVSVEGAARSDRVPKDDAGTTPDGGVVVGG